MAFEQFESGDLTPAQYFEKVVVGQWNDIRPRLGDFKSGEEFSGKIGQYEIVKDEKEVKDLLKKMKKEKEFKQARDFEYSLMELFQNLGLFDDKVSVCAASDFDDLKRQTDLILSFKDEQGEINYLSVDATIASKPKIIIDKEKKILDRIDVGKISEVKYFISDVDPDDFGPKKMPHVIVATFLSDAQRLKYLISRSFKKLNNEEKEELYEAKRKIVETILDQSKKYINYIEERLKLNPNVSNKKRFQEIKNQYQHVINFFSKFK